MSPKFENLDDAASAIDDYTPGKLRKIDFSASPDQQGELLPIIMSHYAVIINIHHPCLLCIIWLLIFSLFEQLRVFLLGTKELVMKREKKVTKRGRRKESGTALLYVMLTFGFYYV